MFSFQDNALSRALNWLEVGGHTCSVHRELDLDRDHWLRMNAVVLDIDYSGQSASHVADGYKIRVDVSG